MVKQSVFLHVWTFFAVPSAGLGIAGEIVQKISPLFGYKKMGKEIDADAAFVQNPQWITSDENGNFPVESLVDPKLEILGVASCDYQNDGHDNFPNSSWAHWEDKEILPMQKMIDFFHLQTIAKKIAMLPFIRKGNWKRSTVEVKSGLSINYWNDTDKLIEDIKKIGVHHYRCSIDRSIIEKKEGVYDEEAITHYRNIFQRLFEEGIEPNVTLHHFNDPQWFMEKGGWENKENISSYLTFIQEVMPKLLAPYSVSVHEEGVEKLVEKKIRYCSTFNESAAYAFVGYALGDFPPGKVLDFQAQARVLKNMLNTHDLLYDKLKIMDPDLQVGITHDILHFHAYNKYNPIASGMCHYFSQILNGVVMDYFKTGDFCFQVPLLANLKEKKIMHQKKLDWFGVQYYSEPLLSLTKGSACYPDEKMVEAMPYRFYPQGLLNAIKEADTLEVPLMVSESGIADFIGKEENSVGVEHTQKILQVMQRAVKQFNVIGFYQWCLRKNYEWGRKDPDFGLLDSQGNIKKHGELFIKYHEALQEVQKKVQEAPIS